MPSMSTTEMYSHSYEMSYLRYEYLELEHSVHPEVWMWSSIILPKTQNRV